MLGMSTSLQIAAAYLIIGISLTLVGPIAGLLRHETSSVAKIADAPKWKVWAFALVMGGIVATFWPVVAPIAAVHLREEKRRNENSLFKLLDALGEDGTDQDMLPGGVGEFGLVVSNPIPTKTIFGSRRYLSQLHTESGETTTFNRVGSTTNDVSPHPIDIYDIQDEAGERIASIYLSPYNKKNSCAAPKGFRIGPLGDHNKPLAAAAVAVVRPMTLPRNPSQEVIPEETSAPQKVEDKNLDLDVEIDRLIGSAQSGDIDAQFELGKQKLSGSAGVIQDIAAGFRWLERAALYDHVEAQLMLASAYEKGDLAPQDLRKALRWAREAYRLGHKDAGSLIRKIEQRQSVMEPKETQGVSQVRDPNQSAHSQPKHTGAIRSRNSNFDFDLSGQPYDSRDLRFLKRGVQRGLECMELASDHLRDADFVRKNPEFSHVEADVLAEVIARRRGYLDVGSDKGMAGLIDGADINFDQRRACFIRGVWEGIEGADLDECLAHYALRDE